MASKSLQVPLSSSQAADILARLRRRGHDNLTSEERILFVRASRVALPADKLDHAKLKYFLRKKGIVDAGGSLSVAEAEVRLLFVTLTRIVFCFNLCGS